LQADAGQAAAGAAAAAAAAAAAVDDSGSWCLLQDALVLLHTILYMLNQLIVDGGAPTTRKHTSKGA
jgi:hypothetical protein